MVGADNGPPCPRSCCAAPDQPRRDDSMKVHFRVPAAAARSHPAGETSGYREMFLGADDKIMNDKYYKCHQYQSVGESS